MAQVMKGEIILVTVTFTRQEMQNAPSFQYFHTVIDDRFSFSNHLDHGLKQGPSKTLGLRETPVLTSDVEAVFQ